MVIIVSGDGLEDMERTFTVIRSLGQDLNQLPAFVYLDSESDRLKELVGALPPSVTTRYIEEMRPLGKMESRNLSISTPWILASAEDSVFRIFCPNTTDHHRDIWVRFDRSKLSVADCMANRQDSYKSMDVPNPNFWV